MNEAAVGRYRWTICALLFFATTINYIDRQVLGILAPTLQREIGWSEAQYGVIVSWFTLAYAIGFLGAGRIMDRLGTRVGYGLSIVVWSVAVPGARASVRHRSLQRRLERGGDHRAGHGPMDHAHLGMAVGVHRYRGPRLSLARGVAGDLPQA